MADRNTQTETPRQRRCPDDAIRLAATVQETAPVRCSDVAVAVAVAIAVVWCGEEERLDTPTSNLKTATEQWRG